MIRLDYRARKSAAGYDLTLVARRAAELRVGDIHQVEPNIHAGAKYMDQLMTRYFPDATFSEGNRPLFAFASYNCGPGNVAKARRHRARAGGRESDSSGR